MIDTHAHLDFKDFDEDREEAIQRAFDNGVKCIINVGVDLESSKKSIALAEKYENIFATVGIHPEYFTNLIQGSTFPSASSTDSSRSNLFRELKKLAKHKKVVAIGEAGLDYYQRSVNSDQRTIDVKLKELQKNGFIEQIKLAQEFDLPVIVHCREAWHDLFKIISNFKFQIYNKIPNPKNQENKNIPNTKYQIPDTKFVLHCYSGNRKDTEKFLKMPNIHFSFSGNITYPKPVEQANNFSEVIQMIPLDRIMLDSDSPFLAPQARRGKRNEPANVRYIAGKIAEIKGISGEEIERVTDEKARKFFRI